MLFYKIFTFQGNPVTHKYPVTAFKWILVILSGHAGHFTCGNSVTILNSEHITKQNNKNTPLKCAHLCVPASKGTITNLSFSTSAKLHPTLCF